MELGSLLYVDDTEMFVKSELDIDAVIYTTRSYISGITMWLHQRHKVEHLAAWWEKTDLILNTSKTKLVDNH